MRTTLSVVIGRSVPLKKAGNEFKACCPFHSEKSPSFTVNDDKGFYHCFGCSAHGDAIRFLTDYRGLGFMDAVKELAAEANMEVPAPDPRAQERAEQQASLHDMTEAAAKWFQDQLSASGGAEARSYLERRGISKELIARFGIGWGPDDRSALKVALGAHGEDKLIETGLLIQVDGKPSYDRFRGRVMIPIRDPRGRTIAFGGRILGTGEPKYLNSPETPLFDKGRTLYNLDRAQAVARKSGRIIVVEGYMDAIALSGAGIDDVVAPLGTALTENHIEMLWRISDVPLLCFDGDAAGERAALRAAHRALPLLRPGKSLAFVALPPGQDPDDLVRAGGPAAFERLAEAAEPLVGRLWRSELAEKPVKTPEARAGLRQRLFTLAKSIPDEGLAGDYRQAFRERLDALGRPAQSKGQWKPGQKGRWQPPEAPVSPRAQAIGGAGYRALETTAILAGFLRYPDLIQPLSETLAALPVADGQQDQLRSALLDAAFSAPKLDSQALIPILRAAGLDNLAQAILGTRGLSFSFSREKADEHIARRDLSLVIEAVSALPEIDAALVTITDRLGQEMSEDLFAEQLLLQAKRRELENRLIELAQGAAPAGNK